MAKQILVLGIGNLLLQDEGLGVRAVERLSERYSWPPQVLLLDGGTLGLDLLSRLDGVSHLLILDAIRSVKPGGVHRLEGDAIPSGLTLRMSMHQVGLQELLSAARLLGSLPPEVVLLGLDPVSLDWGTELTLQVQGELDELVEAAAAQLAAWGAAAVSTVVCEPAERAAI